MPMPPQRNNAHKLPEATRSLQFTTFWGSRITAIILAAPRTSWRYSHRWMSQITRTGYSYTVTVSPPAELIKNYNTEVGPSGTDSSFGIVSSGGTSMAGSQNGGIWHVYGTDGTHAPPSLESGFVFAWVRGNIACQPHLLFVLSTVYTEASTRRLKNSNAFDVDNDLHWLSLKTLPAALFALCITVTRAPIPQTQVALQLDWQFLAARIRVSLYITSRLDSNWFLELKLWAHSIKKSPSPLIKVYAQSLGFTVYPPPQWVWEILRSMPTGSPHLGEGGSPNPLNKTTRRHLDVSEFR